MKQKKYEGYYEVCSKKKLTENSLLICELYIQHISNLTLQNFSSLSNTLF